MLPSVPALGHAGKHCLAGGSGRLPAAVYRRRLPAGPIGLPPQAVRIGQHNASVRRSQARSLCEVIPLPKVLWVALPLLIAAAVLAVQVLRGRAPSRHATNVGSSSLLLAYVATTACLGIPVRGRDGAETDLNCLKFGAPHGPQPRVARPLTDCSEQWDPRLRVHPDGQIVLQARMASTRGTEPALIPEPTLVAADGVCLKAGAAQAARCGPGSRAGALGGGCAVRWLGQSTGLSESALAPRCMRIFSFTGRSGMAGLSECLPGREWCVRCRTELPAIRRHIPSHWSTMLDLQA